MNGGRQDQTPGTISWGREKAPENSCGEGRSLDQKKKKKGESARPRKGREKHEAAESDHWGLEV